MGINLLMYDSYLLIKKTINPSGLYKYYQKGSNLSFNSGSGIAIKKTEWWNDAFDVLAKVSDWEAGEYIL